MNFVSVRATKNQGKNTENVVDFEDQLTLLFGVFRPIFCPDLGTISLHDQTLADGEKIAF